VNTLALPLRVGRDGLLERDDHVTALLSVIRAMAFSPRSTWAHAPWFGLQEVFENANTEREDQHDIQDALNRGLAGLGVTWASVGPVRLVRGEAPGVRRFELALLLAGGQVVHRTLNA
jgi:hypothetical protein